MQQHRLIAEGLTWPESPRWHRGALYIADVYSQRVVCIRDDETVPTDFARLPGQLGGMGFLPDGRLLMAGARDHVLWWVLPDGSVEVALDLSGRVEGMLNDLVVDAAGRVWFGATGFDPMAGEAEQAGRLWRWTPGTEPVVAATDLRFPNGLALTPDGRTLYLNESFGSQITAFDVGPDGSLAGRRVHAALPNGPDGLCLDAEGGLWAAVLFDKAFLYVSPDGGVVDRVDCGGALAVACVLGGEDRRTLYLCVAEHDFADPTHVPKGSVLAAPAKVAGAGCP